VVIHLVGGDTKSATFLGKFRPGEKDLAFWEKETEESNTNPKSSNDRNFV